MPLVRAMQILQAPSGDPKDRYVNVWHFTNPSEELSTDFATNIGSALDTLYAAADPYIPASLVREDYRLYVMTDPTPREPTYVTPTTQPSGEDGSAFPYEVAATLSFYSVRNIRSYRGRIYLGPLRSNVAAAGPVNDDPVISSAFRNAMVAAADDMVDDISSGAGTDGSGTWVVYSPTDELARPITHVWMDDAFDTIRARGTAASERTTLEVDPL